MFQGRGMLSTSLAALLVLAIGACGGDSDDASTVVFGGGTATDATASSSMGSEASAPSTTTDTVGTTTDTASTTTDTASTTTDTASTTTDTVGTTTDTASTTTDTAGTAAPADIMLPLALDGGRVVDSAGQPFLLTGDSAWSLIASLDDADTLRYLDDRAARGFNAVLVNLVEHKFTANAPANAAGDLPFPPDAPFQELNDAYFDHAAWVVREAQARGIVVLLAAAYAGHEGGDEGWYHEMEQVGPDAMRAYGEEVGRRFADLDNIIWVGGGDYTPPDMSLVDAVQDGIKAADPDALQTAHGSGPSAAATEFPDNDWLDLNAVYAPSGVAQACRAEFDGGNTPFFLIEATYENEYGVTTAQLREQAYAAVLNGAFGQIFGNNPIWHFDGPGLYDTHGPWQSNLDSRGSRSMTVWRGILESLDWPTLTPAGESAALVDRGDHDQPTSVASSGSTTVAYVPDSRTVRLAADADGAGTAQVMFIDPTTGSVADVMTVAQGAEPTNIRIDRTNGDGSTDWVLVVRPAPD